ncbi:hypothetical protein K458DRAFT_327906 [Lentithecium fluviatile CBS 122367]|uniref:Uncharacterized protein n=1 Tax=Lentithecium fluviatile CBS 122367 TaxID=1168545 RepID=A0A6G1JH64_9PLEO|nr:hypothetical protein K458DRAFT_327906 [Lentithecium fluviatile CBS 122367]
MSPLHGFSDNPFKTRDDFKTACISLLRALKPYQSPGRARIKLPLATGTHFDDIAAQLEGFARPLWAIAALVHGECLTREEIDELVWPYSQGLANGTDPNHEEYWGPVVVRDQRMVEMEIISFALLTAPDDFFHCQSSEVQRNITEWLKAINGKDFPVTNWLWFRVMTNLALTKVCGVPYQDVKEFMDEDLDHMEQFYLGEGWAADGVWNENGRQADYYSGSFAIQFSQLLYVRMARYLDPERCARFEERAIAFASLFWRYFDENGAAIPFGRSLTYRFAFAGFWSAIAFAGVNLVAPLNDWGACKGLLLRHFRWWSEQHNIFNIDGTLTIGFTYPNMYMSEDYNSPQSPYWAMKSFVALALPETHPFWKTEERALPESDEKIKTVVPAKSPMQIVCHTGHHHYLLSSGQFCPWPLKATEAKYGKFAYSSHFGFSVPTGSLLAQTAPDSTLALSNDGGDTWRVPWKSLKYEVTYTRFSSESQSVENVPTLISTWNPWKDANVEVQTVLIAPSSRFMNWHIRRHKIVNNGAVAVDLDVVQGGFAIQGREVKRGGVLPSFTDSNNLFSKKDSTFHEGALVASGGALVCSSAGASGIQHFGGDLTFSDLKPDILKPDANTNLMWQRTLIPALGFKTRTIAAKSGIEFTSGVFAMARRLGLEEKYDGVDVGAEWHEAPKHWWRDA